MASCLLLVAALVLPTLCAATGCGSRPPTWEVLFPGVCIWVSPIEASYIEAHEWCQSMQSILINIRTEAINNRTTEILQEQSPAGQKRYWMGLNNIECGDYKWIFDFPLDYENFKPSEPRKECANVDRDGEWKTDNCEKRLPFICAALVLNDWV